MARDALSSNQIEKASMYYFQSINWYSPIGSSQTAAEELFDLAENLNRSGKERLAYQAFSRLRIGLNAARSFYFPRNNLLEKANYNISLYLAASKLNSQQDSDDTIAAAEYYFKLYQNSPKTNEGWYLAVLIGFFLWSISIIKSIFILFSDNQTVLKSKKSSLKIPIILFIMGYTLWIIAMTNA
jgi:hypothetical protein